MIFISYRRSDGKATAQLIKDSLVKKGFEEKEIFLDLHDILGEEFPERCRRAIDSCDKFLLLITKNSFVEKEGHDYYFDEIHQALDQNKKIIPVMYEATFDESTVPEEFQKKRLHLISAIRLDMEYKNESMSKLVSALIKGDKPSVFSRIARWFAVPLVFITIYLIVSFIFGVVRYVWDTYWLSDEVCAQYASEHVIKGDEGIYYYATKDSLYMFNSDIGKVSVMSNAFANMNADMTVYIEKSQLLEAGFWTLAVGLVYEVTKFRIKPHGNNKQVGVIVAATICVIAGVGFGFVCERMFFPVYECRMIRRRLHSSDWWYKIISPKTNVPVINPQF